MIYERGVETCLPALALFLAPSLSFIPTASSQHSRANIQKSPWNFVYFLSFLFIFTKTLIQVKPGGTSFFFACLSEAVKRNRVWLHFFERLFEESHLLSGVLSVHSSRLVPHVLLYYNTLLWGRMSRTQCGACVVFWIFSLVACKVPGKMNFYCYFWLFFLFFLKNTTFLLQIKQFNVLNRSSEVIYFYFFCSRSALISVPVTFYQFMFVHYGCQAEKMPGKTCSTLWIYLIM